MHNSEYHIFFLNTGVLLTMAPREPELIGKTFSAEDGTLLEGPYFFNEPNEEYATGFKTTEYNYKNGKIHGSPAIMYPDGQEEDWDNGNFVEISLLPWSERFLNEKTD